MNTPSLGTSERNMLEPLVDPQCAERDGMGERPQDHALSSGRGVTSSVPAATKFCW